MKNIIPSSKVTAKFVLHLFNITKDKNSKCSAVKKMFVVDLFPPLKFSQCNKFYMQSDVSLNEYSLTQTQKVTNMCLKRLKQFYLLVYKE